jgi:conjugative transfer signal peptidase TraF
MIAQGLTPPIPRLIYNKSNSAPVGWYHLDPNTHYYLGSKVAAFAPEHARELASERGYLPMHIPLLKTIWAVSGDQFCVRDGTLFVGTGLRVSIDKKDQMGRAMPQLEGCHLLGKAEFLLLSTDVQASWDSRYFGPVSRENIIGKVTYLGPTLWSAAKRWAGHG